ncbi:MAG: hypothetical protein ABJE47_02950 [bacterium]
MLGTVLFLGACGATKTMDAGHPTLRISLFSGGGAKSITAAVGDTVTLKAYLVYVAGDSEFTHLPIVSRQPDIALPLDPISHALAQAKGSTWVVAIGDEGKDSVLITVK